jgi:hypothetical protein
LVKSFIVARQIYPSLRRPNFSLESFTECLFDRFPDLDNLNFVLICRRAANDQALGFFTHLTSFRQATLLREAPGKLTLTHARLVLSFLFSLFRLALAHFPCLAQDLSFLSTIRIVVGPFFGV